MPKVTFIPENQEIEALEGSKILALAAKNKVNISFSCGALRCGLCFFDVKGNAELSEMTADEKELLGDIGQVTDGTVRMACKTQILSGELVADLTRNLS